MDHIEEAGLLKLSPSDQIATAVWSADFARCLAWTVIESVTAAAD